VPVGENESKERSTGQVNEYECFVSSFVSVKSNSPLSLEVWQSTCIQFYSLMYGIPPDLNEEYT
jgi:hypothetical protein